MLNKKSIELSLTVVIVAVILLFTAVVLLAIFSGLIGKESRQAQALIGDGDEDGILDMADTCPCTRGYTEYKGCENQAQLDDPTKHNKNCK